MKSYTLEQLREMKRSAARELAFRKHVYPRQVARGRMNPLEAQRELDAMELIVGLLDKVASASAGVQGLPGMEG